MDVSREGGASASKVERTHDRTTLTSWVVGPLHRYTQEGWVDNNNNMLSNTIVDWHRVIFALSVQLRIYSEFE